MINTRFLLGMAAYIVPSFALGMLWHLSLMKPTYDALQIYRADILIPMGLGSMFIQGAVYSWIYPRLFSTARADWMKSAALFFLIIGGLAWSLLVLPVAAKFNMTSVATFTWVETAYTAIQHAIAAVLLALVYRNRA